MRDFFIRSMEQIINVVLVIGAILVVLGAISTMFHPMGGFLSGLMVLCGGAIYLLLMGGMIYMGLGIYHNTRRTAEAVERLASR